jgi:hypothetical protein
MRQKQFLIQTSFRRFLLSNQDEAKKLVKGPDIEKDVILGFLYRITMAQ